ncbi:DUF72 domain-containing protein [Agaricicola taiwanensis]|nr:DUF72 domain-containing protein [Agaricicola taiwanensis]
MIRVGIGGWTFEPWRDNFFPKGLPHARELEYASRQVTSIEVNGTFYRTQTPSTFRKWADQTPDDFIFSLKAPRFTTNRRVLAEAGSSIAKFLESGVDELGEKLGPILWQFPPTKAFNPEDFGAFLALLPKDVNARPLRHAVEVRHDSFLAEEFIALTRRHEVAVVLADSAKYPLIADLTGPFVYARLQQAREDEKTGYSAKELEAWRERARLWEEGKPADDLPLIAKALQPAKRDVFVYMINGAKVRAPAAAMALLEQLQG